MKPRLPVLMSAIIILSVLLPAGCGKKMPLAVDAGQGYRRTMLVEVFTSENCSNCPKADAAAERIAAEMGDSLCLIELHPRTAFSLGDSIGLAAADTLVAAYERDISGSLPLMVCDGISKILGTAVDIEGTRQDYRGVVDVRKTRSSPLHIAVTAQADQNSLRYAVTISSGPSLSASADLGLVLVVVEDSVNAYNKLFRCVARAVSPGTRGERIGLPPSSSATRNGQITTVPGWLSWRLSLVAYVRDNATGEVLQAAKARVVAATAPPAAPALAQPANGGTNVSLNPTLSWIASSGAASYALHLATDSTFTNIVYYPAGLTGTSQKVGGMRLANSTTYYWRVNASNNAGISEWSAVLHHYGRSAAGSARAVDSGQWRHRRK